MPDGPAHPASDRLTANLPRRWRSILSSLVIVALLALLALMLIWMGVELAWTGNHLWVGLAFMLVGLWMALAALTVAIGAVEFARLPDPVLDIGPDGLLDRRLSTSRIAWADLDWDRIEVVTMYGSTDQVRIRLKRPYPLRLSASGSRLLGLALPMAAFRGRPLFIGPLGPDATTDRIEAAMSRHRAPSGG